MSKDTRTIAVVGGKGGVGKSCVALNLATVLEQAGQKVLLVDANLGMGNIEVLTGINASFSLNDVVLGQKSVSEVREPLYENLDIVAAGTGIKNLAEANHFITHGLVHAISEVIPDYDVVIFDLGPSISNSVIDFSMACQFVLFVLNDDPMSLGSACKLVNVLCGHSSVNFHFLVVSNKTFSERQGRLLFMDFHEKCGEYINQSMTYLGAVPFDKGLQESLQRQLPVTVFRPVSKVSRAFQLIAKKLSMIPCQNEMRGHVQLHYS